jgi:DNA-binding NtrC family response regulator
MTESQGHLLFVDDDRDVLVAARLLLKQHGYQVSTESDPRGLPRLLRDTTFDAVFLDMNFTRDAASGREGFHWLSEVLTLDPQAVVVLVTAYGDVEMAVRAIKAGATDFVLKPWQNEKLLATAAAAVALRRSRQESASLRTRQQQLSADLDQPFSDFVGQSPAMGQVYATIAKVAATDASVLILGENGSGKELVARAIHRHSPRAGEVFLAVDMGAVPETLFEAELFGHVKGAFTDAKADRPGRFEVASGGTLFLDEIGNLSPGMQAKLLATLENRRIVRVGANRAIPIDVRLICATNQPLYEMVTAGAFRQDLLYRINTVELRLPPLRERQGDVALLAAHYAGVYARKYGRPMPRLTPAALARLEAHRWPGNVRELQHAVERALIMGEGPDLDAGDFLLAPPPEAGDGLQLASFHLEDVEKEVIRRVLARHQGNVSQAARELGLTRGSLYRRLERYGL